MRRFADTAIIVVASAWMTLLSIHLVILSGTLDPSHQWQRGSEHLMWTSLLGAAAIALLGIAPTILLRVRRSHWAATYAAVASALATPLWVFLVYLTWG